MVERPTTEAAATRPGGDRKAARPRLALAAVTILLWALSGVTIVLSVYRDRLQSHFDISTDEFGLLISIGAISGALGALIGGVLADRRGPRIVLRACLISAAAGMALAGVPAQWLVMLVAMGVASLFVYPMGIAAQSYLVRLFPRRRRRVLSLSLVAMSVGGVGFPLLAEGLLHLERTSSATTFAQILHVPFALTAVLLLLGALAYRGKTSPTPPGSGPEAPRRHARKPLSRESLLLVALLVVHGTCDNSAIMWMPRVLGSGSFAERVLAPGAVVAAFSLAYVLSRILLSLLPERWGMRFMMIAPGVIGGGVFLAGILSKSQLWTAVCYVLGGFCWSFEYPAILSTLAGNDRRRFGSALGLQTVATGLATFAMANVMGHVGTTLGESSLWVILLLPAAGFPVVSLGAAIWAWRFGRTAAPAGAERGE